MKEAVKNFGAHGCYLCFSQNSFCYNISQGTSFQYFHDNPQMIILEVGIKKIHKVWMRKLS